MAIPTLQFVTLLGADDRAYVASRARRKTYRDGELIHDLAVEDPGMAVVVSGAVRLSTTDQEGHAVLLTIVRPGENFGDMVRNFSSRSIYSASAMGEAEVDHFDPAVLDEFLERPGIVLALYRITAERLGSTLERLADSLRLRPDQRVAKTLDALGRSGDTSRVEVTQEDLASFLGLSSVSIAKALASLKRQGLIRTGYRYIDIVDPAALGAWLAAEGAGG